MNATRAKKLSIEVPAEKFITGYFTNGKDSCCALGHLLRLTSRRKNNFSINNCKPNYHGTKNLFNYIRRARYNSILNFSQQTVSDFAIYNLNELFTLVEINDKGNHIYSQKQPKDRVIALLDDMIKAGY